MAVKGKTHMLRFDMGDVYDPRVIPTPSRKGTLFRYVPPVGPAVLLIKADDGESTNWQNTSGAITLPTVFTIGATTATTLQPIPEGCVGLVEYRIIAKQILGVVGDIGDGASYIRTLHVENQAGILKILLKQTDFTYAIDPAMSVSFAAVGSDIVASFTGVAGRTFEWGTTTTLNLLGG